MRITKRHQSIAAAGRLAALWTIVVSAVMAGGTAWAAQPEDWGLGLQPAATPIMEQITGFHNFLLVIITAISLFVLLLLIYVMVRFNRRANPTPSKTSHNTLIEIVWTVVPVLILLVIAVPSFRLLYAEDVIPEADLTIKAIGRQWYWSYEYPDHGNFAYDAYMLRDGELEPDQPRLLATDMPVVVPVGKTVRLVVTASDVIHSWAMPAFGVKKDAIPGRLNETWFRADKTGTYYGQCSELCGKDHAFMPIMVKVVSDAEFAEWIEQMKEEYASADDAGITLASLAD